MGGLDRWTAGQVISDGVRLNDVDREDGVEVELKDEI
jgi:hypothetical protein